MYVGNDYIPVPRERYEKLLERETRSTCLIEKVMRRDNSLFYGSEILRILGKLEEADEWDVKEEKENEERRKRYADNG